MSQLIDRPVTPVIPLSRAFQPEPPRTWPRDPEAERMQMQRAAVLAAVVRATSSLDLPSVAHWDVYDGILFSEMRAVLAPAPDRGQISGQLLADAHTLDRVRLGVQAWADALHGRVIETPRASYLDVNAVAVISGVVVCMWNHVHPDSTCPTCDGLAVGDIVLRHESHCPLLETPGGAQ